MDKDWWFKRSVHWCIRFFCYGNISVDCVMELSAYEIWFKIYLRNIILLPPLLHIYLLEINDTSSASLPNRFHTQFSKLYPFHYKLSHITRIFVTVYYIVKFLGVLEIEWKLDWLKILFDLPYLSVSIFSGQLYLKVSASTISEVQQRNDNNYQP